MNIVNKFIEKRVSDAYGAEHRDVDRHPMIHPFPSNMGRLDRYNIIKGRPAIGRRE
jgi:hypothetical protein